MLTTKTVVGENKLLLLIDHFNSHLNSTIMEGIINNLELFLVVVLPTALLTVSVFGTIGYAVWHDWKQDRKQ